MGGRERQEVEESKRIRGETEIGTEGHMYAQRPRHTKDRNAQREGERQRQKQAQERPSWELSPKGKDA